MVEQKTPGNRYHDAKGRFAPGNPGNPNSKGRPKSELTITDILRAELQKRPKLIQRWLDLCESADENVAGRMLVSLANRLEGLPRQAIRTKMTPSSSGRKSSGNGLSGSSHPQMKFLHGSVGRRS